MHKFVDNPTLYRKSKVKTKTNFADIKIAVVITIFVSMLILVVIGDISHIKEIRQEKKEFMAECLNDEPEYKCRVLWSQLDIYGIN